MSTIIKPTNGRVVWYTLIKPTNGRVVWYTPDDADRTPILASSEFGGPNLPGMAYSGSPLAAHVCAVHGDRMINVLVIDRNGVRWMRHRVTLVQEGDQAPPGGRYCHWMPYRSDKALAAESLNPPSLALLRYSDANQSGSNEPGRDPK